MTEHVPYCEQDVIQTEICYFNDKKIKLEAEEQKLLRRIEQIRKEISEIDEEIERLSKS